MAGRAPQAGSPIHCCVNGSITWGPASNCRADGGQFPIHADKGSDANLAGRQSSDPLQEWDDVTIRRPIPGEPQGVWHPILRPGARSGAQRGVRVAPARHRKRRGN